MINLPDVTLVAVSTVKHSETLRALRYSLQKIQPAETIFFTDVELYSNGIRVEKIEPLSWKEYSSFILKQLHKYINTSHVLIVQHDSWVLDETQWDERYLWHDYIGARWLYEDGRSNGNGGFSLRSKRLLEITALDPFIELIHPEDECIGRLYRSYLETKCGVSFAPDHLCDKFAFELRPPSQPTFGFHSFHHRPYRPHIIISRQGAMGDVIMCEPVMEYFHNKGYQVVLDTDPKYMNLFFMHPYPVMHISELPEHGRPERLVELDMAYEEKPKQLALKSYFKKADVAIDFTLRNARLNYPINNLNKLFLKYAVIHIDDTAMPHRNIRGVDWREVKWALESRGYAVFQVGNTNHEIAGTYINTRELKMLMYVIAGADLVIANDSGVGQVASALNRNTIMFFGSVLPEYRYIKTSNLYFIQNECDKAGCYHEQVSVNGTDCVYDKLLPPCTRYSTKQVTDAISFFH
jgi:ADP-heptose:LPS heptosyltransferase